jgi:hypothetical protein
MITKIYTRGNWKNIKPETPPKDMREVTSFAVTNQLRNLVKLQGGYYVINNKGQFEFLGRALYLFSFQDYYNKAK